MNEDKTFGYSKIRDIIYERQYTRFPYLQDWKRSPYTWLKARYYIESSAVLVYFLLKTKIHANQVTLLYAASGIAGGILLAIPSNTAIFVGVFLFFNKSILDWSDGYIARLRDGPSVTGDILDHYGAKLNSLALSVGLGFYVYNRTGYEFLIYIIPLIPLFHASLLTSFARGIILNYFTSGNVPEVKIEREKVTDNQDTNDGFERQNLNALYPRIYNFFTSFLDDRARSVDFILLIILVEMYINVHISLLIFTALTIRWFVVCAGSFYVGVKAGWAESLVGSLTEKINR